MLTFSGCADVAFSGFVDYQQSDADFATFVEGFLDPTTYIPAEHKNELPLFMPAEYARAGVRRCATNVLRVGFLVFDIDKGGWDDISPALGLAQSTGYIVYTSFSHSPAQLKMRLLVKLNRPVEITEWSAFWIRAVHHFGLRDFVDMHCSDACHMYYVPGGNAPQLYQAHGADGPGLDVDAVLRSALPAGEVEATMRHYQDVLDEDDRGEIDQGLKDVWEGKLSNLADELRERPYPGEIYSLKSHATYGIARGIPHIISEQRVRGVMVAALEYRYRRHAGAPTIEGDRQRSLAHIDIAIAQGMETPWYPPKVEDLTAFPLTDWGLAERLIDKHEEDLAHEPNWKNWLVWNGRFWNLEAGDKLVMQKMKATIRAIPEEADAYHADHWEAHAALDAVKDDPDVDAATKDQLLFKEETLRKKIESIHKFATASEAKGKTMAGIDLASSEPPVVISNSRLNRDPYLLNFSNGTLDLRTGTFGPHDRSHYITRMIPHAFDASATSPLFDKFLAECMLDRKRLVAFLWRLLGYSAIGVTTEQILILCIGDGANGKSTFMNTILAAFGQGEGGYGFAANSENLLTTKGGSRHETWRMSLFGKRIVACQEVEEGRTFAESLIKELTGSDTITGRKMRQDEWSFDPVHQIWMCANHLPHVRGTDEGIWRRLQVIPWDANFKGREDRSIPAKLKAEIPGIWARIAREAALWCREGLVIPREVVVATAHYRREQDPLRPWLEGWCALAPDAFGARDFLWAAYLEHCEAARTQVFHEKKRFYAALEKRFKAHKTNGVRGFRGLRLMTPLERMAASPRAQLIKAQSEPEGDPDNVVPITGSKDKKKI